MHASSVYLVIIFNLSMNARKIFIFICVDEYCQNMVLGNNLYDEESKLCLGVLLEVVVFNVCVLIFDCVGGICQRKVKSSPF